MPAYHRRRRLTGSPGVASALLLVVAALGVAALIASSLLSAAIHTANDTDKFLSAHQPRPCVQYYLRHLVEQQQLTRSRHHKKLLPLDSSDYLGFFFSAVGLMIAAGGGIGGGGVLVPIYILVMKFTPKYAIPLSNVTVFGGAVANTVLNMSKRHPLADRPLVDWDLILVMEPLTIAGALLGAFLNKLLPEAILVISLVALLSFTAYETLKKAIRMYKAETAHQAQHGSELTRLARTMDKEELDKEEICQGTALLDEVDDDDEEKLIVEEEEIMDIEEDKLSSHPSSSSSLQLELPQHQQSSKSSSNDPRIETKTTSPPCFSSAIELQNEEDLHKILEEERHVPSHNVQILCLTLGIIIFINLIKGGGSTFPSPLGITCGSIPFWFANGLMILWTIVVIIFAREYLIRRYKLKARVNYPYVEGDIAWDNRATIIYPVICTAAGFFAGMFGVGGGIVTGPLMLAMGVHPKVSSATNAVMILFTSFPVTTSFIVFGLLDMEYAGVCLVLGFVATLVGQWGLFYLMQKYQRNSYIAFSIGGIVLLSAFLMTIQSLLSMADSGGPRPPAGLCTTN